jgi:hypothetical protein
MLGRIFMPQAWMALSTSISLNSSNLLKGINFLSRPSRASPKMPS